MENVNWNAYYKPQDYAGIQGNPGLDILRQRIQQKQAQQTQENADFTKEISKLNFNGARDAQLPELHSQYGDIVKTFGDLRNTTDPKERAAKSLQLQQMQNQFLYNIEDSKERGKKEQALINITQHPNVELADGAQQKIAGLTQLTGSDWDKAYNDVNQNLFAPKWDAFKESADIAKSLTKDGKPIETQHVDPATGQMVRTTSTPQVLDKDAFVSTYVNRTMGHPAAVKIAQQQTGEADPAIAVVKQAQQLYATHQAGLKDKVIDKNAGRTLESEQEMHRRNRLIDASIPINNGQAVAPPPQAPQTVAVQFKTKNGDGSPMSANFRNYKAVAIPKATVIPTLGVDDHGTKISVPAGEYRVIGYADMPVIKGTTKVAQPGFEQQHPELVETKPIAHIQSDVKGRTKNFYVNPNSINVNNTGQKNQNKAVQHSGMPKQVTGQAEYESLPKGTQYIAPNGKVYIKK